MRVLIINILAVIIILLATGIHGQTGKYGLIPTPPGYPYYGGGNYQGQEGSFYGNPNYGNNPYYRGEKYQNGYPTGVNGGYPGIYTSGYQPPQGAYSPYPYPSYPSYPPYPVRGPYSSIGGPNPYPYPPYPVRGPYPLIGGPNPYPYPQPGRVPYSPYPSPFGGYSRYF